MSHSAQWSIVLILLGALDPAPGLSCTINQVYALNGRDPGEAALQM